MKGGMDPTMGIAFIDEGELAQAADEAHWGHIARAAARWWAAHLRGPAPSLLHDAGWTKERGGNPAAAAFGDFLAAGLRTRATEEQIQKFEDALTTLIAASLTNPPEHLPLVERAKWWPSLFIEVDYDPDNRLREALYSAGIEPNYALPHKTRMHVTREKIEGSRGYGTPSQMLYFSRSQAALGAMEMLLELESPYREGSEYLRACQEKKLTDKRRSAVLDEWYRRRRERLDDLAMLVSVEQEAAKAVARQYGGPTIEVWQPESIARKAFDWRGVRVPWTVIMWATDPEEAKT